jgi:hypothetical protein
LESLNLQNNEISEIDEDAFVGLKKLKTIDLSNNQLENITTNIFHKNLELKFIELQDNKIKTVDVDVFKNLSNLEEVNLFRNKCISKRFFVTNGDLEPMRESLKALMVECNKPKTTEKPKHISLRDRIYGKFDDKNIWRPLFVH